MMLRFAVEVAGTVCGEDCSISSQTVDRLPSLTADRSLASQSGGQKPHRFRLLRLRNASTRWRFVAVMNPLDAVTRTSAVTRRPLGRWRVSRSQSCRGAQHAKRVQRLRAVTDNSTDMF